MADEQKLDAENPEAFSEAEQVSSDQAAGPEALQARVAELEEQLTAAKDQALRASAELQNIRRRAEQDVEKAHKFALEKFAGDLLSVVDSIERGLELSNPEDESVQPIREGMDLTLKMLQDILRRHEVKVIDPQGEAFNPEHHQAVATEENTELDANKVLRVFQKGYLLSGRLLRPAMVVVSKAP